MSARRFFNALRPSKRLSSYHWSQLHNEFQNLARSAALWLGRDHTWTKVSARVTADALDALGRTEEAKALRERYGVTSSDDPKCLSENILDPLNLL